MWFNKYVLENDSIFFQQAQTCLNVIKYGAINAWKWLHPFITSLNLFNYEEKIRSKMISFGPCFLSRIDCKNMQKKSIWTRGLGLKLVFSLVRAGYDFDTCTCNNARSL